MPHKPHLKQIGRRYSRNNAIELTNSKAVRQGAVETDDFVQSPIQPSRIFVKYIVVIAAALRASAIFVVYM